MRFQTDSLSTFKFSDRFVNPCLHFHTQKNFIDLIENLVLIYLHDTFCK